MNPTDLIRALTPQPDDDTDTARAVEALLQGDATSALELLDLPEDSPLSALILEAGEVVRRAQR